MAQDIKIERKLILDTAGGIFHKVRNGSGGALAAGDVVIWDTSTTNKSQVTTTTSQDSGLVAGVMIDSCASLATGTMQSTGYYITENLKVDGTTDIAVGDFLSTFTTAKIAAKASTGTAGKFAIALEAYATNDSAGTIKAILVFGNTTDNGSLVASVADDTDMVYGTGSDAVQRWSTGDASAHTLNLGLDNTNQAYHITDKAAVATDWAIADVTHPTVYLHSNTTPTTDYLRIGGHDGTTAYVDVVGGTALALEVAGTTALSITAAETTMTGEFTSVTSVDSVAAADQVSFGRYEIGAANTVIALSQETAVAADTDETKFSNKVQVRINGATYFIMLTTT